LAAYVSGNTSYYETDVDHLSADAVGGLDINYTELN
jgi:hypothetical protein